MERPEAVPMSSDSIESPVELDMVQARCTDGWASMAESALSSRADGACAARGVDAAVVGV